MKIQIELNGETHCTECLNLQQLVESFNLHNKRFAVECDGMIIPKHQLEHTAITAGQRIEIIQAIGGG